MSMRVLSALLVCMTVAAMPVSAEAFYPSYAQYLGQCSGSPTWSKGDLEASIKAYHEHIHRLAEKFVTGFYKQTAMEGKVREINLKRVVTALEALAPRRAALLFYAFADRNAGGLRADTLCIWLISPHIEGDSVDFKFLHEQVEIPLEGIQDLRANIVSALGVMGLARQTGATNPRRAFEEAARVLLPSTFVSTLERKHIDTLVVLPIFDIGAIPFAALPVDEHRSLIDIVSVVVAPGFFVFLDPPHNARTDFSGALIAADPLSVPNAKSEAEAIGSQFENTKTVIPAYRRTIQSLVTAKPGPPLIYIAAHGRADETNPLEGSDLTLSDGPWTAKEIGKLDMGESRPLVVLSACETGLGKNFEVGNIGVARAWHQAGASNVIMSLWRVHQASTQRLMTRLTTLLPRCPPDVALRAAMLRAREHDADEAQWSGFSIFGLPERPITPAWNDPAQCGGGAP